MTTRSREQRELNRFNLRKNLKQLRHSFKHETESIDWEISQHSYYAHSVLAGGSSQLIGREITITIRVGVQHDMLSAGEEDQS